MLGWLNGKVGLVASEARKQFQIGLAWKKPENFLPQKRYHVIRIYVDYVIGRFYGRAVSFG